MLIIVFNKTNKDKVFLKLPKQKHLSPKIVPFYWYYK